jgi:IS30 family transposase
MKAKKYVGLSDADRSQIQVLLKRKNSIREIAQALERSPNTISREITVHSSNGTYNAKRAKDKAREDRRSRRYQWRTIEHHPELRAFIIEKLSSKDWSPDSIAAELKKQTALPTVSKDQIYDWLYSSYGQPYCQYLCTKRYKPKKRAPKTERVMIPDRVPITERPPEASDRKQPGHWEGDTIVSGKRTHSKAALVVIQERSTRLLSAQLIPNLKPESFSAAVVRLLNGKQVSTLTLDNGIENKQHATITAITGADVYFCDPYSSYQKGGVENGNKMIRRYVPKGCDLGMFTQKQIDEFIDKINNKPRRCLGYKSAVELAIEKGVI